MKKRVRWYWGPVEVHKFHPLDCQWSQDQKIWTEVSSIRTYFSGQRKRFHFIMEMISMKHNCNVWSFLWILDNKHLQGFVSNEIQMDCLEHLNITWYFCVTAKTQFWAVNVTHGQASCSARNMKYLDHLQMKFGDEYFENRSIVIRIDSESQNRFGPPKCIWF